MTPGVKIRDEQPQIIFPRGKKTFFGVKILKFFDADPGWKLFGSGMGKSRIRDKLPAWTKEL